MIQSLSIPKIHIERIVPDSSIIVYSKEQVGKKSRADYIIEICHRLNNKVYVDKINT